MCDFNGRTFAGLDTFDPCMIEVCAVSISTLLESNTATRATTEFAGFLERATLGAWTTGRHHVW